MRSVKTVALVAVCIVALGTLLFASQNKFGVASTETVSFDDPVRVGNVVLPQGDYQITHTMEGEQHIMVFRQLHVKNPAEARVRCTLVTLPQKANRTEKFFTRDSNNQRVLQELTFRGEYGKARVLSCYRLLCHIGAAREEA